MNIKLEHHWTDNEEKQKLMQEKLNKITEKLSEDETKELEKIIGYQYSVGFQDGEETVDTGNI